MDKKSVNKKATHPLQTWEWGEFRKDWGNEVLKTEYGILTLHKIPLTNFKVAMLIRGRRPTQNTLSALKKIGRQNKVVFIKLEPNETKFVLKNDFQKTIKLLKKAGAVAGKTLFTPTSFWIDISKPQEELMKSFSSKTRYNIRLAERKGVKVTVDDSDKAFEKYLELTRETVERQGFYAHSEKYHRLMWKHLNQIPSNKHQTPVARLLTAKYKGEIITAWIVFVWHDFLYYPYGASSTKHKNVMANNLMMWEAIKFGKKMGLKTFDLWGREPGKGFTKFKEGYAPKVVEFLGTWDLVINKPAYYIFRAAEIIRWPLLRLKTKFSKSSF